MQSGHEAVQFLSACHQAWCEHFVDLQQRGHWHIAMHLGTRGRAGVAAGELQGLVRQSLLLDDATVRDRITRLINLGFCTVDPPDRPLSARTAIIPTTIFLNRFDRLLMTMGQLLSDAANTVSGGGFMPPADLDGGRRQAIVNTLNGCRDAWFEAVEEILAERGLSHGRVVEARRHLQGASHWLLVHLALEQGLGISTYGSGSAGILADRVAALLVEINGQNFQTTRDHINELIGLGLLEKRPGRALHIGLPPAALTPFRRSLVGASETIPIWAAALRTASSDAEPDDRITMERRVALPEDGSATRYQLVIRQPAAERRALSFGVPSLVIGRAPGPGATLTLAATDVSRRHCRIDVDEQGARVSDLASTNGTMLNGKPVVGTTMLPPGGLIALGSYVLAFIPEGHRLPASPRKASSRNKSGKSV